eukprot:CFRG4747T1
MLRLQFGNPLFAVHPSNNLTQRRLVCTAVTSSLRVIEWPSSTQKTSIELEGTCADSVNVGRAHEWEVANDLLYYPNFITEAEHGAFVDELEPVLSKRKWEKGHWDSVINQYREISKSQWKKQETRNVLGRILTLPVFGKHHKFHPVHVLDLNHDGEIMHHVDNDYAGDYVVGLTLLSPRVMEFKQRDGNGKVQMLVEPRSLYIMRREMRHKWTHAILGGSDVVWDRNTPVPSQRRITIMVRDFPQKADSIDLDS